VNEQWRRVVVSAGARVLAVAGCSEPANDGSVAAIEAATSDAMDFTLPDLDGNPIRLADYRGKTVIVDFWATWCPPCLFQVPELNKLQAAHADAGDVVVIGVAVDVEGAEVVAPWAAEQGVAYQLVLGDEDVAREFGAMGFPTLVVIWADGEIDSRHVGLIELEELESLVAGVQSPDAG
jgi:thiol-disulfide isomerase/thioredoxin